VSAGAVAPSQWNSTLGTTLVIKGVTRGILRDSQGRVYCHRHPDGYWLPGGASNTGGEGISRRFEAARFPELNAQALAHAPTGLLVYPLARTGERFPFSNARAEGFVLGEAKDEAALYAAYLEGVGYVERLAYDTLASLGAEVGDRLYVAGGATGSLPWLQIRADILGKTLCVPEDGGGAKGAAVLAAAGTVYRGIIPAARAMVDIVVEVAPRPALRPAYDERYAAFCAACRERGYIV
jgi:xylulokinase